MPIYAGKQGLTSDRNIWFNNLGNKPQNKFATPRR